MAPTGRSRSKPRSKPRTRSTRARSRPGCAPAGGAEPPGSSSSSGQHPRRAGLGRAGGATAAADPRADVGRERGGPESTGIAGSARMASAVAAYIGISSPSRSGVYASDPSKIKVEPRLLPKASPACRRCAGTVLPVVRSTAEPMIRTKSCRTVVGIRLLPTSSMNSCSPAFRGKRSSLGGNRLFHRRA